MSEDIVLCLSSDEQFEETNTQSIGINDTKSHNDCEENHQSKVTSYSESHSLYVGDLDKSVSKKELFDIFATKGDVTEIVIPQTVRHQPLGYAYVNYKCAEHADRAIKELNYTEIGGNQCRIMRYSKRSVKDNSNNIFIQNLHESIDKNTLYNAFNQFGTILSCQISIDAKTNKSNGYGYISFIDKESALRAVESTNGMILNDKTIKTELFQSRKERVKNAPFTNVYVKYIPSSWTENELIMLFENATNGKIISHYIQKYDFGRFACLGFETSEQAKLAIEKLNGAEFRDKNNSVNKLYVARSQKRKERQQELQKNKEKTFTTVYVKHIPSQCSESELVSLFERQTKGKIISCKYGGTYALLNFKTHKQAKRAVLKLNGAQYSLSNHPATLHVSFATKQYNNKSVLIYQNELRLKKQQQRLQKTHLDARNNLLIYGFMREFADTNNITFDIIVLIFEFFRSKMVHPNKFNVTKNQVETIVNERKKHEPTIEELQQLLIQIRQTLQALTMQYSQQTQTLQQECQSKLSFLTKAYNNAVQINDNNMINRSRIQHQQIQQQYQQQIITLQQHFAKQQQQLKTNASNVKNKIQKLQNVNTNINITIQQSDLQKIKANDQRQKILIQSLTNENNKLRIINQEIQQKYNLLWQNNQQLKLKYMEVENKYQAKMVQIPETNNYLAWSSIDCANWILNINKSRYQKYYHGLLENILKECVDGSCLNELDKTDLHRFGVTGFKDKCDIYNSIQQLININKNDSQNEGSRTYMNI